MRKFSISKNVLFFLVTFTFVIMIGGLYFEFNKVITETNREINKIEVRRAQALTKKILSYLKYKVNGDFQKLFRDRELRSELSKFLSLNITDEFKYIYVIYQDKDGSYRYLLDGSYGVDRGLYRQKFYPLLENLWRESLQKRDAVYGFQKKADGLWVTYLQFIDTDSETKAILALDISTKEYENLNKFLKPLYGFLKIFMAVLVLIVLAVVMQLYMFYKERRKSTIDSLTRLYNRNYLKEIWKRINLDRTAIIMLDIDHFKQINDRYGHDVGDIVLSSIAKKLMSETRLEDRIIRYGGEEFLILVNFPRSDFEVIQIANRILQSVKNDRVRINENLNINVTVSMGVNVNPVKSKTLRDAIRSADKALYRAKKEGRNRVVFENLNGNV